MIYINLNKDCIETETLEKGILRQFFRFKRLAVKWCIIPLIKDHINDNSNCIFYCIRSLEIVTANMLSSVLYSRVSNCSVKHDFYTSVIQGKKKKNSWNWNSNCFLITYSVPDTVLVIFCTADNSYNLQMCLPLFYKWRNWRSEKVNTFPKLQSW